MSQYETLVNILDHLREEAPKNFKRYHPAAEDLDGLNQARARAFIHLFLKVKFGLTDFQDRENQLTDGTQDGGIDAYFVDYEKKKIYLIQSKFRTTESNFREKEIKLTEILQMDVDKITRGEEIDTNKSPYNSKIKTLIQKICNISDIGRWDYKVIILANLSRSVTSDQLKKLTGGFDAEVFNYEKTYQDLVFPVVQGTYYDSKELMLSINLSNTTPSTARISYWVTTKNTECQITVLFVPTIEIAKALYKYRNSILKFNPRSYLELTKNEVNKDIAKTINELDTNEFALYNNGITILSTETNFNDRSGQKGKAQIVITQPQIINGGQTAYTLSRLYEDCLKANKDPVKLFEGKEVLVKIIALSPENEENNAPYLELIENISKATNQQSQVNDADRRSNEQIQIRLQKYLFQKYGYFYEKKTGEFGEGIRAKYIDESRIIDRETFLRMCQCCDGKPAEAFRTSKKNFEQKAFNRILYDDSRFSEYFFTFKCYEALLEKRQSFSKDQHNKNGVTNYGNGLMYGQYGVISVCRMMYKDETSLSHVDQILNWVLKKWREFEEFAIDLPANSNYFTTNKDQGTGTVKRDLNFSNYYKGRTINQDVKDFFSKTMIAVNFLSGDNGIESN